MLRDHRYHVTDPLVDPATGVLRNTLGITDPDALDYAENAALIAAYHSAALGYDDTHRFTIADVRALHKLFLGGIYPWAGEYRQVDLSSAQIRWCHAKHIPSEMERFNVRLQELTPCAATLTRMELVARLAELHAELVVIHPFRDGNGRTTRLLTDLLLLQADRDMADWERLEDADQREEYHQAIRAAWKNINYQPLQSLLDELIP